MSPRASQLLITKLKPPVSLASAITRPRLLSYIGEMALQKVVLVTAAAGFGKSTLLAQWYDTVATRSGWLSLDRNDQDPVYFLRYLVAGLNQAGPVISAATEGYIEGRATLDLDEVTTRLGNDLAKMEEDRILFLDDYYLAETSDINSLLMKLIERSPASLHIVIASRTLPALPVASLKAHDALLEISAQELKFNQLETETFMHVARKLDLDPSEMRVLNERTEGWAAGLQLASLYLKDSQDLKRSIEELSGGIRDINDYLATDVVKRLSPDVQEFLLSTSVLERMNAGVCNALLDTRDGQSKLEQIEALGLFLFPLDATRGWYRYHHLFRDYLLIQLKQQKPKLVNDLYRKASTWFSAKGYAEEAVNMALEAGDFDQVAMLVEATAMDMIIHGHMPQLHRWIRHLPEQVINQRLRFPAYHCWALVHMGKCHQAETLLARAEIALKQLCDRPDPISGTEKERLRAELRTLRVVAAVMADDVDRAYELSRVSIPDRADCAFFSGCCSNTRALCETARGDFELAKASADAGKRFHRAAESPYGVVYGHCVKGLAYQAEGRLSAALKEMEAGHAVACRAVGPKSFSAAMPRVLGGVLLYERNCLDEAFAVLDEYLPLVEECAHIEIRTAAFLAMAGILGARGQMGAALQRLDQAISVSSECIIDRTQALVDHEGVRLRLMAGDVADARRFARHIGLDSSIGVPAEWNRPLVFRALVQCRLLTAEGKAEEAISYLEGLAELAAKTSRVPRQIQILTLLVIAYAKTERKTKMFATISEILHVGAREGYIRSIIDQGPEVGRLFHEYATEELNTRHLSPDIASYLDDVCAACEKQEAACGTSHSGKMPPLVDPAIPIHGAVQALTDREINILQLLAGGATNMQIGAALNVSVNTVRWHVANILSKMQVENRTQAASAAHSLGLVNYAGSDGVK